MLFGDLNATTLAVMDLCQFRCAVGSLGQCETPNWQPLLDAVGEHLTGTFMWMSAIELDGGLTLHAYKHISTRAYLYLDESGRAFQWTACGGYARQRLDFAIEAAICNWWTLDGWDEKDRQAVIEALRRAQQVAADER